MLVSFASLLTFPVIRTEGDERESGLDGRANVLQPTLTANSTEPAQTVLPPPSSHILCSTTFPAPASFLPWHYARHTLQAGGSVVWIGCSGLGETHVRGMLRKAMTGLPSGKNGQTKLVFFDALDALANVQCVYDGSGTGMGTSAKSTSIDDLGGDARPALLRLQHRLEQALGRLRGEQEDGRQRQAKPVLVVLDDAAALAWTIESLSASEPVPSNAEDRRQEQSKDKEDPRIRILRDKRKQGGFAVHQDEIGHRLGTFIEEQLRAETCDAHGAVLLTHLTTDNASIFAPQPRTPASRGGSYGVGTGFDADDAGEENEDEELYEEHPEEWQQQQQAGEDNAANASAGVAAAGVDWRVDSLLRRLLLHADVWLETRGLRSGRARDCHGEVCVFGLARPCRARNVPLPKLPMPADPLDALRSQDRSARPLTQFSRLSLATTASTTSHKRSPAAEADASAPPLSAWKIDARCEGREAAMLFRVEPSGEAQAWSRGGSARQGS